MTKERPILFSAPMVRALLDGRKTQTRRKMRLQPRPFDGGVSVSDGIAYWDGGANDAACVCPYGTVGDRLWVRETFGRTNPGGPDGIYYYRADGRDPEILGGKPFAKDLYWTPSIFMPREASRISLEVTGVRVERLHAISRNDCMAEGIDDEDYAPPPEPTGFEFDYVAAYRNLWESINGAESWDANPWVWVIEFNRIA